jgi:hypothetical protein
MIVYCKKDCYPVAGISKKEKKKLKLRSGNQYDAKIVNDVLTYGRYKDLQYYLITETKHCYNMENFYTLEEWRDIQLGKVL